MSWETIITVGASLIIPPIAYLVRRFMAFESKIDQKVDEKKVQQLLHDKIEPLKEDLTEIKQRIEKLIDFCMKK